MAFENDLLVILKVELAYLDQGRYDLGGKPPRMKALFVESPSCPNLDNEGDPVPCSDCLLMRYVDPKFKDMAVPCHHIVLDADGNTVAGLSAKPDKRDLKKKFRAWLVAKIAELEAARGGREQADAQRNLREAT